MRCLNVNVGDSTTVLLSKRLVLVRRFGELGDDVPGVEEARHETQAAKEDVNDGVGAANTTLDPYYILTNVS